jgi:hypothetical protein
MPMRPCQPVDPSIARTVARQMEQVYGDQPRPNFLFDADGQRRPLSADEPCSQAIFEQWVSLYAENGGEVEPVPRTETAADESAESCPYRQNRVQIVDPWERGVADAPYTVRLADGREISGRTDDQGYVDLPDDYQGDVELVMEDQPFDVIESAPGASTVDKQDGYARGDEDEHICGQMVFRV